MISSKVDLNALINVVGKLSIKPTVSVNKKEGYFVISIYLVEVSKVAKRRSSCNTFFSLDFLSASIKVFNRVDFPALV